MAKGLDPSTLTDEVTRRILAAPKYRRLDEEVVRRFASEAVRRVHRPTEAVKYAKRKLHQAFGAFVTGSPAEAIHDCVAAVLTGQMDVRSACLRAMRAHASSAERAEHVEDLFTTVAAWCGPVETVADLACGLNPLAIPWMGLADGTRYQCSDIDEELVSALPELGKILPIDISSETRDLVANPPAVRADLVLLLKTLTTLERQQVGATANVLDGLNTPQVVLSLPARSLSGKHALAQDPRALVQKAVDGTRFAIREIAGFGDEVVCHLVAGDKPQFAPRAQVD